jgi:CTP-dependent riboflavin kinase
MLRMVVRCSGDGALAARPKDVARGLGVSCQAVVATARRMEEAGLLGRSRQKEGTGYHVTREGAACLEAGASAFLLVEVDGRLAGDVACWLRDRDGVTGVAGHGAGCCCRHCPREGECR